MKSQTWRAVRHIAAITAGLSVFAFIFTYTGDADLLYAVGTGLGVSLLVYLGALAFNDALERP